MKVQRDAIEPTKGESTMRTMSATVFRRRLGAHLKQLAREPVTIEKGGRPVAVVVSVHEWERLQTLDDAWWARAVDSSRGRGFLSTDETATWLTSRLVENVSSNAGKGHDAATPHAPLGSRPKRSL